MIPVKICGIRRLEDALVSLEEGAWALGFIFHKPSPRFIEPVAAADLLSKARERFGDGFRAVGVFVDWPIDELNKVVREVGLDVAQLHGAESLEYAESVEANETWKAFRVGPDFDAASLDGYPSRMRVLLDGWSPTEAGGTGEVFDWSIARGCQQSRPVLLAGGINAGNLASAITQVGPFGLDVSSGVESSPGIKDPELIRRLFSAARACSSD